LRTGRLVADVGHIDDLLDDIGEGCAMRSEQPLDLVIGIDALRVRVANVQCLRVRAFRCLLVLRSNAGEIDRPAGPVDGHDFGKPALRPRRRIVSLDLELLRRGGGYRDNRGKQKTDWEPQQFQHDAPSAS